MEKRKDIDMLRFYGGDIHQKNKEGEYVITNNLVNPKNKEDVLWGDRDAYRTLNNHIRDMYGQPPVGKYLLKMEEFPDYRNAITSSREELLNKILDEKDKAVLCLEHMNNNMWKEDYHEYVEWKNNLHSYLKLIYSDMWYGEREK